MGKFRKIYKKVVKYNIATLKSIKSIGYISDAHCLAEIKYTSKFKNVCKFWAYAGLNISVKNF
ncbi:transposase [Desulfurella sp.]|uniref:transposase n=1 Tax=Desulfurella sp. TaxID=1962857 RepID=UPI003D0F4183